MLDLATIIKNKIEFSCIDSEFKEALVELIHKLIDDDKLEKKCFNHPLGFTQVKIIDFDPIPLQSLRIHIWSKNRLTQQPNYFIHNHSFDFKSFVLCGYITNYKYSIQNNSNSDLCLYTVRYNDEKSTSTLLKTDKVVNCKVESRSKVHAGQLYTLNKNEFHSTKVNEDIFAATLFTTFNRGDEVYVVGETSGQQEYIFKRQNTDRNILTEQLKTLKIAIEGDLELINAKR